MDILYKNKPLHVAYGVMGYLTALVNNHHVDEVEVLKFVKKLCKERIELVQNSRRWQEYHKDKLK